MTTITQLTKAGKNKFIPAIEKLGFKHFGKLIFVRETEGGVHQVISPDLSYGENLKFYVTCFVEEFDSKYMDKYPTRIPLTSGGRLGEGLLAGELWDVETLDNVESIFDDIFQNIQKHAVPWFDSVQTRKDYVRVLYPHLKEKLEDQGKLDIVLGGGE